MVEQLHPQTLGLVREGPLGGVWVFFTQEGIKAVWHRHFTNISVEIGLQPSNLYGFFGLLEDPGGILVDNVEVRK